MKKRQLNLSLRLLAAASLLAVAGSASAATFDLVAEQVNKTMPDGSVVPMWGYRLAAQAAGTATVPGPTLRVPAGDTELIINLTNALPQAISLPGTTGTPTSVVIPGQRSASAPAMFTDGTNRSRVRSLAPEATSGATTAYTWSGTNLQPGTYLYHSGTQPQVQVQMGLYGAVIVEAGANLSYVGEAPHAGEITLLYSEIDPALHAAVANGTYGTAPGPTSTLDYAPKYFLVNGEPFVQNATLPLATAAAGSPTLLRMLNAGLQMRVPVLQGLDMRLIAEDGKRYPFARTQYSAFLPPLKTMDAIIVPTADGNLPIYDRRLALANGAAAPGGMFRVLRTGGAPIAQADGYSIAEDNVLTIAAPGVLFNDFSPGGALTATALTQPTNGTLALAGDGSFTYTPNLNFNGSDSFTYQACISGGGACSPLPATIVSLTVTPVNDAPVAVDDGSPSTPIPIAAGATTPTTIAVLANDYDPDGPTVLTLTGVANLSVQQGAVAINAAGTAIEYTPPAGYTGSDSFQYVILDPENAPSNVATVYLMVQ